jgi:hypothetical protein
MANAKHISDDAAKQVLNEDAAMYENAEITRRKEDMLLSDTDKFRKFTRLMRIGIMLKNAKITHSKIPE